MLRVELYQSIRKAGSKESVQFGRSSKELKGCRITFGSDPHQHVPGRNLSLRFSHMGRVERPASHQFEAHGESYRTIWSLIDMDNNPDSPYWHVGHRRALSRQSKGIHNLRLVPRSVAVQ